MLVKTKVSLGATIFVLFSVKIACRQTFQDLWTIMWQKVSKFNRKPTNCFVLFLSPIRNNNAVNIYALSCYVLTLFSPIKDAFLMQILTVITRFFVNKLFLLQPSELSFSVIAIYSAPKSYVYLYSYLYFDKIFIFTFKYSYYNMYLSMQFCWVFFSVKCCQKYRLF